MLGCTLVCHDLPFHRMPRSATDWPKCFCNMNILYTGLNAQKLLLDGFPGDPICRALLAVLIIREDFFQKHIQETQIQAQETLTVTQASKLSIEYNCFPRASFTMLSSLLTNSLGPRYLRSQGDREKPSGSQAQKVQDPPFPPHI